MYSGNKNGFSIIKLLLFCLLFLFFMFLVMWIVKKSAPNLDPIYDSIFRDNINNMQDAGEAYFTNDKLPTEIGEEVKITLQEMLDKNYILPFTDKNGDACNLNDSYVLVVKTKDGYELRTYLKCGNEAHQLIKVLGCHDLCDRDCNKEKVCTREKITQYQFYKLNKVTKTSYSCSEGKLSGKNCIISYVDKQKATVKTSTKTESKTAETVTTKKQVTTEKTSTKVDVPVTKTVVAEKKEKVDDKVKIDKVYTDSKKRVETNCVDEKIKDPNCKVQCVPTYVNGILQDVCNTCGYVTHKKCTDTDVWYCPDSYKTEGSGSNIKCYKNVYSCPAESTDHSGSGSSLKCWHYRVTQQGSTTYSCPSNATHHSGSGSSLKCWYYNYTYSCPSTANYREGSGSSLKCYTITSSSKCDTANGWTLKDGKCYKTTTTKKEVCSSDYKLSNHYCTKDATKTVKATSKKTTSTKKVYKWSKSETLKGWTRTGKTKETEGKEVCE